MRERYSSNLAFLDVFMNITLGVTSLFIIAFLLIKDADFESPLEEPPVELMVILTWPGEIDVDVDLWAQVGANDDDVIGFRSPKRQGIYLDIDDLGSRGDEYQGKQSREVAEINQEIINFRRIPDGEIVINAMHYFSRDRETAVPCTVHVIKLNPFIVIYEGIETLYRRGDERTFVRFKINNEGEVYDLNHIQKSIVYAKPADTTYSVWGSSTGSGPSTPPTPNNNPWSGGR